MCGPEVGGLPQIKWRPMQQQQQETEQTNKLARSLSLVACTRTKCACALASELAQRSSERRRRRSNKKNNFWIHWSENNAHTTNDSSSIRYDLVRERAAHILSKKARAPREKKHTALAKSVLRVKEKKEEKKRRRSLESHFDHKSARLLLDSIHQSGGAKV